MRRLASHPAALLFAVGNEIPPGVVRWHGRLRVERFLRRLYQEAKDASPESLFTYVNFPPTEFLDLSFFDVCAFNVYLHQEPALRSYIGRLQHVAGHKPLLLAEAGADSIREGATGQADITSMHVRVAFEEGACATLCYSGYGRFDSDEFTGWIGELGREKSPEAYGHARRALPPGAAQEAAANSSSPQAVRAPARRV